MKLLLLSPCGLTNEPEDVRYINLYLASLKRHVVPYFDVKVLLYNNSLNQNSQDSLTLKRVKEFGLENVVEVKNMYEMNLPEHSLQFVKELSWQNKIGIVMNMLFDYAKSNNFFDADWIFHTDTDIEFLSNFKDNIEIINNITKVQSQIVITLAGDTYPYYFSYNNSKFIFDEPQRINLYTDKQISGYYQNRRLKYIQSENETCVNVDEQDTLVFNLQQQKVRNDFVGISKEAAKFVNFNWITCSFPSNMFPIEYEETGRESGAEELYTYWKNKVTNKFYISFANDKGSIPQLQLQQGIYDIIKIQLRSYKDMVKHFGSGYFNTYRSWIEESYQTLKKDYVEYEDVWNKDYIT